MQASDISREARELLRIRDYMDAILAEATQQPFDKARTKGFSGVLKPILARRSCLRRGPFCMLCCMLDEDVARGAQGAVQTTAAGRPVGSMPGWEAG